MISILLWLWDSGAKPNRWGYYRAPHVNRAAAMIRANLRLEHEIVCITDNPAGIDPSIRIVPLWDDLRDQGRCWCRLKLFDPETAKGIGERLAWIDLDMLVTGDLTPLFERTEDLVLWRSQTTRCPYNGSMLLMTAGAYPEVWEEYRPRFQPRYPGSDQAWLAHILGPNMPVWTQKNGVISYVTYCRTRKKEPPEGSRIIFFPGSLKSNATVVQRQTPWVQRILDSYSECGEDEYDWTPRHATTMRTGGGRPYRRPDKPRAGVWVKSWG